jgi:hypothetical protein
MLGKNIVYYKHFSHYETFTDNKVLTQLYKAGKIAPKN